MTAFVVSVPSMIARSSGTSRSMSEVEIFWATFTESMATLLLPFEEASNLRRNDPGAVKVNDWADSFASARPCARGV